MSTYDEESLLADVKGILVAKLNAKIAAVEAEKVAAGFPATSLAAIDTTNGYLQQNFSSFPYNISPALFFAQQRLIGFEKDVLSCGIGFVGVVEQAPAQRVYAPLLRRHPCAEIP